MGSEGKRSMMKKGIENVCVEPVVLLSTYCIYNLKKDVW